MTDHDIEPETIFLDHDERAGGGDPHVRRLALIIGIVVLAAVSLWLATSRHTPGTTRREGQPRVNAGGEHSFGVLADDSTFYYAVEVSATAPLRRPRIAATSLMSIDNMQAALYTRLTANQIANLNVLPTPQPVSSVGPGDFLVLITGRIDCLSRPDTDQTPAVFVSYLDSTSQVRVQVSGMPVVQANLWQSVCQPLTHP
jgi:hypothetical protein